MGATADQNLNLNPTNFTLTGTQNDANPSGFSTAGTYQHSSGASVTLNGLVPTRVGRLIGIRPAAAAGTVSWVAEAVGSSAANRFATAGSGTRLLWADPLTLRWRAVGVTL